MWYLQSSIEDENEPKETEELMAKGALSGKVYIEYIKSGGSMLMMFFLVFLLSIAQGSNNAGDLWLTYW